MGSIRIVVLPPRFDQCLGVVERQELMDVQTFVAQAAVERFDVAIVRGLARPREIELHAAVERPRLEGFGGELRPVIDGDGFREISCRNCRFKGPRRRPSP